MWGKWWLRKGKKIMVVYLGTVLGLKRKVIGSFINLFREVSMVWFFSWYLSIYCLLGWWILIHISFQDEETSEDLIICIIILLKWNKFSSWFFYLQLEGFSTLYFVSLFFGRMFLDYYCLFLLGCYYYWMMVIIIESW